MPMPPPIPLVCGLLLLLVAVQIAAGMSAVVYCGSMGDWPLLTDEQRMEGVERLVVATNVNDILHRALSAGDYSRGSVVQTPTPSMDIQVSSNFERLLHALDGEPTAEQMRGFEASHTLRLTPRQLEGAAELFASRRVDGNDMSSAMRWAHERGGEVVDPHTGVALAAALTAQADAPVVTLATAHPAKFRDAVERATGTRPMLPHRLGDLFQREERYATLPATFEAVTAYIAERASPR